MPLSDEMIYSQFAQYYIEMVDELNGLNNEAEELIADGAIVPEPLKKELLRHQFIVNSLTQVGLEKYNKEPKQLYHDGWNFWFKEDAELREQKYGKKGKE